MLLALLLASTLLFLASRGEKGTAPDLSRWLKDIATKAPKIAGMQLEPELKRVGETHETSTLRKNTQWKKIAVGSGVQLWATATAGSVLPTPSWITGAGISRRYSGPGFALVGTPSEAMADQLKQSGAWAKFAPLVASAAPPAERAPLPKGSTGIRVEAPQLTSAASPAAGKSSPIESALTAALVPLKSAPAGPTVNVVETMAKEVTAALKGQKGEPQKPGFVSQFVEDAQRAKGLVTLGKNEVIGKFA